MSWTTSRNIALSEPTAPGGVQFTLIAVLAVVFANGVFDETIKLKNREDLAMKIRKRYRHQRLVTVRHAKPNRVIDRLRWWTDLRQSRSTFSTKIR